MYVFIRDMQVLMHDWWWELNMFLQKKRRIFSQNSLYEDYSKMFFSFCGYLKIFREYPQEFLETPKNIQRIFGEYSKNVRRTKAFEGYFLRRERHSGSCHLASSCAKLVCILEERGCRAQHDRSVLSNTKGRRSRICGDRVS